MPNAISGDDEIRLCFTRDHTAGVGVAIKAGGIAAGDFASKAMPGAKKIRGGDEIKCYFVNHAGIHQCWRRQ